MIANHKESYFSRISVAIPSTVFFINMGSSVEVVISGFAGKFPESDNIQELQENLMNKVDMVTEDERRWKHGKNIY